jgi:hypothetical protein
MGVPSGEMEAVLPCDRGFASTKTVKTIENSEQDAPLLGGDQ